MAMTANARGDTVKEYEIVKDIPAYSILWHTRLGMEGMDMFKPGDREGALKSLTLEHHGAEPYWEFATYNERGGLISSEAISLVR